MFGPFIVCIGLLILGAKDKYSVNMGDVIDHQDREKRQLQRMSSGNSVDRNIDNESVSSGASSRKSVGSAVGSDNDQAPSFKMAQLAIEAALTQELKSKKGSVSPSSSVEPPRKTSVDSGLTDHSASSAASSGEKNEKLSKLAALTQDLNIAGAEMKPPAVQSPTPPSNDSPSLVCD